LLDFGSERRSRSRLKQRRVIRMELLHRTAIGDLQKTLQQGYDDIGLRLEQSYCIDGGLNELSDEIAIGRDQTPCRDNAAGADWKALYGIPAKFILAEESKIDRQITCVDLSHSKRRVDRLKRSEGNDCRRHAPFLQQHLHGPTELTRCVDAPMRVLASCAGFVISRLAIRNAAS